MKYCVPYESYEQGHFEIESKKKLSKKQVQKLVDDMEFEEVFRKGNTDYHLEDMWVEK